MSIKNKVIASVIGAAALVSGFANAMSMDDSSFYVGADVGYGRWKYADEISNTASTNGASLKKGKPSLGIILGGKFHENFGAELGYTFIGKTKAIDVAAAQRTVKARNIYLDAIGYVPVDEKINFLGAVGVGKMRAKVSETSTKKDKAGIRLGVGGQYNFDNNLAARAMVRYQRTGSSGDVVKNRKQAELAVLYTFM